jgi:type IV pilus assembly protein PilB
VNLICAQRLVRRICKECKEEIHMPPQALVDVGFPVEEASQMKIFKGRGCGNCNNTGYRGRVGLFEVMEISDEVRELILSGASAMELKRKAIEEGMISLRASGIAKIREGMTTVEEVVRETVQ